MKKQRLEVVATLDLEADVRKGKVSMRSIERAISGRVLDLYRPLLERKSYTVRICRGKVSVRRRLESAKDGL